MEQPSRTQRKAQKDLIDALRRSFGSEDVRYVLRWLIEIGGVFTVGGDEFSAGRRSMALDLMGALNVADPHMVVRLMQEGADEVVRRRSEANRGDDDDVE